MPAIWRLEVANSLHFSVRRKRVVAAFRDAALADLARMRIIVDPETDAHAWTTTLGLAEQHY